MLSIHWQIACNIKENTRTLIDARNEVDLKINIEKSKYVLVIHHHNVRQNWDTKLADGSFVNVS
jgi:hypothetical protein